MYQVELRYISLGGHTRSGRLVDVHHLAFLSGDDHLLASEMEPAASDVTRAVACSASSSMRAASSAYSNFAIRTVCAPMPTVMPGFTCICYVYLITMNLLRLPLHNVFATPTSSQCICYTYLFTVYLLYLPLHGVIPVCLPLHSAICYWAYHCTVYLARDTLARFPSLARVSLTRDSTPHILCYTYIVDDSWSTELRY